MPDPTRHVTSLDLSRKLKAAGVPQDALFYWWEHPQRGWIVQSETFLFAEKRLDETHAEMLERTGHIAAYTASELGAMLPSKIHYPIVNERGEEMHAVAGYLNVASDLCGLAYAHDSAHLIDVVRGRAATEADARAALLLALIEAGNVNPESLNNAQTD